MKAGWGAVTQEVGILFCSIALGEDIHILLKTKIYSTAKELKLMAPFLENESVCLSLLFYRHKDMECNFLFNSKYCTIGTTITARTKCQKMQGMCHKCILKWERWEMWEEYFLSLISFLWISVFPFCQAESNPIYTIKLLICNLSISFNKTLF